MIPLVNRYIIFAEGQSNILGQSDYTDIPNVGKYAAFFANDTLDSRIRANYDLNLGVAKAGSIGRDFLSFAGPQQFRYIGPDFGFAYELDQWLQNEGHTGYTIDIIKMANGATPLTWKKSDRGSWSPYRKEMFYEATNRKIAILKGYQDAGETIECINLWRQGEADVTNEMKDNPITPLWKDPCFYYKVFRDRMLMEESMLGFQPFTILFPLSDNQNTSVRGSLESAKQWLNNQEMDLAIAVDPELNCYMSYASVAGMDAYGYPAHCEFRDSAAEGGEGTMTAANILTRTVDGTHFDSKEQLFSGREDAFPTYLQFR